MRTLHDSSAFLLKQDGDTLVLDARQELTAAQVRKIDRLMSPADEDSWFGEASRKAEILALIRQIDMPFTIKAEEARAHQQRIGGR